MRNVDRIERRASPAWAEPLVRECSQCGLELVRGGPPRIEPVNVKTESLTRRNGPAIEMGGAYNEGARRVGESAGAGGSGRSEDLRPQASTECAAQGVPCMGEVNRSASDEFEAPPLNRKDQPSKLQPLRNAGLR